MSKKKTINMIDFIDILKHFYLFQIKPLKEEIEELKSEIKRFNKKERINEHTSNTKSTPN